MDHDIAGQLVAEFERQWRLAQIDTKLFLDALVKTDVSDSSALAQTISPCYQLIEDIGPTHHYLSLRRVVQNQMVGHHPLSPRRLVDAAASAIGMYSSDALLRNVQASRELTDMMAECEHPFSLLGKLRTYDFDNPNNDAFIITRPILIIPELKDRSSVQKWEEAKTLYQKEGFLRIPTRITPEEYMSA